MHGRAACAIVRQRRAMGIRKKMEFIVERLSRGSVAVWIQRVPKDDWIVFSVERIIPLFIIFINIIPDELMDLG
jgi:hypothetical protein